MNQNQEIIQSIASSQLGIDCLEMKGDEFDSWEIDVESLKAVLEMAFSCGFYKGATHAEKSRAPQAKPL